MKQLLDLNEKAFGRAGPLEERIWAILEPVAEDMGYRLVRVRVTGDNGCTLQIMAENAQGDFTIEDCEKFVDEFYAPGWQEMTSAPKRCAASSIRASSVAT